MITKHLRGRSLSTDPRPSLLIKDKQIMLLKKLAKAERVLLFCSFIAFKNSIFLVDIKFDFECGIFICFWIVLLQASKGFAMDGEEENNVYRMWL